MHNKENNAGYGIAAVIVFGLIACLLYGLGGVSGRISAFC